MSPDFDTVAARQVILTLIEAATFCDRYRLMEEPATVYLEVTRGEGDALALLRLQSLFRDAIEDCTAEIARLAMECRMDAEGERN